MRIANTPIRTIALFDKDDPNFQLVAEEWPTFLYDEEAGWNAEKAENGLFRGHVLVRVRLMPSVPHLVQYTFTPTLGRPPGVPKQDSC